VLRATGVTCALLSFAPIWYGLAAIARADYFGALLALTLAWVAARTGVELAAMGEGESGQRPYADLAGDGEPPS